jgi:isopentenyl phosphate kinase
MLGKDSVAVTGYITNKLSNEKTQKREKKDLYLFNPNRTEALLKGIASKGK